MSVEEKIGQATILSLLILFLPVLLFPLLLFDAWALVKLWRWFVVPIFQLQELSILTALGLIIIQRFVFATYSRDKDGPQKLVVQIGAKTVASLVFLGEAWLLHLWMVR